MPDNHIARCNCCLKSDTLWDDICIHCGQPAIGHPYRDPRCAEPPAEQSDVPWNQVLRAIKKLKRATMDEEANFWAAWWEEASTHRSGDEALMILEILNLMRARIAARAKGER